MIVTCLVSEPLFDLDVICLHHIFDDIIGFAHWLDFPPKKHRLGHGSPDLTTRGLSCPNAADDATAHIACPAYAEFQEHVLHHMTNCTARHVCICQRKPIQAKQAPKPWSCNPFCTLHAACALAACLHHCFAT